MPISAANSRSAGFTLVEVMTALFVVGLAASAVVLVAPGQGSRTREAAERLAGRLQAASDVSVLTNREVALVVSADGYGFERQDERGWGRVEAEPALAFRAWPQGVAPQLAAPVGEDPSPHHVATFDPLGGATPMKLVLGDIASQWSVTIDDGGEIHVSRDR